HHKNHVRRIAEAFLHITPYHVDGIAAFLTCNRSASRILQVRNPMMYSAYRITLQSDKIIVLVMMLYYIQTQETPSLVRYSFRIFIGGYGCRIVVFRGAFKRSLTQTRRKNC